MKNPYLLPIILLIAISGAFVVLNKDSLPLFDSKSSFTPTGNTELDALRIQLVDIPAGDFTMGSKLLWKIAQPQHKVTVPAFQLMKYELTWDQFIPCIEDGACRDTRLEDVGAIDWGLEDRPALFIAWNDAQDYIKWINGKTGLEFRLPSEAEWEYAARARTTGQHYAAEDTSDLTCDQLRFDGGEGSDCNADLVPVDEWDKVLSDDDTILKISQGTMPVGSYPPNAWGLHDMSGNAAEWTMDCYTPHYYGSPSDGSAWLSGDCDLRVVRGGDWSSFHVLMDLALRKQRKIDDPGSSSTGLRLALDLNNKP